MNVVIITHSINKVTMYFFSEFSPGSFISVQNILLAIFVFLCFLHLNGIVIARVTVCRKKRGRNLTPQFTLYLFAHSITSLAAAKLFSFY